MDSNAENTDGAKARRIPRAWRITGWIAVWLVTLVILGIAIENWLGARAWQAFVEESRVAGDKLDMASIVPAPVPDAENFAAIPLFKPLLDYDRAAPASGELIGAPIWHDPAGKERLEQRAAEGIRFKPSGDWQQGTFVNLAQWQKSLPNAVVEDAPSQEESARAVLEALARFDPEIEALRAVESRPHSRFPLRYEDHISMHLPHFQLLLVLAGTAQARAIAELALGDADAACRDIRLGLRIARSTAEEPLLISNILTTRQFDVFMQPIWEGVTRRQWNDAQLASLDEAISHFDFIAGFQRAIRGERALLAIQALDAIKKQPRYLFTVFNGEAQPSFASRLASFFMPSGWIDFNKAHLCRYHARLLQTASPELHRFFPEETARIEKDFEGEIAAHRSNPRKTIAALAFPAMTIPQQRSARAQAEVDLSRIAIALERRRLKHGSLPPQLDALVPEFLANVPVDITTGAPLHYHLAADGTYTLYSVGWNLRDDGGSVAIKPGVTPVTVEPREGDWVWPKSVAASAK
jgi:hypothetical protein